MITFEQAKQIALQKIGPDCGLIDDLTLAKPYGWYFMYQSNEWLRTRNDLYMLLGPGGFIVERENGHVFEFSSYFPTERNIAAYEYGLGYGGQDLLVKKVHKLEKAVDHLFKAVNYAEPDPRAAALALRRGEEYHPPVRYERSRIEQMLRSLPCAFTNCSFFYRYDEFLAMDRSRCCEHEIRDSLSD
jgi:hypothetical protein